MAVSADTEALRQVGSMPERLVTALEREVPEALYGSAAMTVRAIRGLAPVRTGALRSGIVQRPGFEKSRKRGKYVMQAWQDPARNSEFARIGRTGKRYYYPASQEYGFALTGRSAGRKRPGVYFYRRGAEAVAGIHERVVASAVERAIKTTGK